MLSVPAHNERSK